MFNPIDPGPLGTGSWANNNQNGGLMFGTSSFVMEVGPYKSMFADYKKLLLAFRQLIADIDTALHSGPSPTRQRPPLLANNSDAARLLLKPPLEEGLVRDLCINIRQKYYDPDIVTPDYWNATECDHNQNYVEWALPENGHWIYAFAKGLLRLEVTLEPQVAHTIGIPASGVFVHGTRITWGEMQRVPLEAQIASVWPIGVKTVFLDGLNVGGWQAALNCTAMGDPASISTAHVPTALQCLMLRQNTHVHAATGH